MSQQISVTCGGLSQLAKTNPRIQQISNLLGARRLANHKVHEDSKKEKKEFTTINLSSNIWLVFTKS